MRTQSSKSDRHRFAEWPEGWETEADRLAAFYLRTIAGTDEYELDQTAAKEFSKLAALVDRAVSGFHALLSDKHAHQLVQAFWARMVRSQPETGLRISLDQLLAGFPSPHRVEDAPPARWGGDHPAPESRHAV